MNKYKISLSLQNSGSIWVFVPVILIKKIKDFLRRIPSNRGYNQSIEATVLRIKHWEDNNKFRLLAKIMILYCVINSKSEWNQSYSVWYNNFGSCYKFFSFIIWSNINYSNIFEMNPKPYISRAKTMN